MLNRSQISEELAKFLNEKSSLDDFEDWFVVNTWNIHQAKDTEAEKLVFAVEESLAEFSSHHISETQLRQELRNILLSPDLSVIEVSAGAEERSVSSLHSGPSLQVSLTM